MDKTVFKNRRELLKARLKPNSVLILFSGHLMDMTNDEQFDFEVNKNFYYFTGINQDNVAFVIDARDNKEYLYIEENDPIKVKWVGAKLYPEQACEISGIETIKFLPELLKDVDESYVNAKAIYLDLEKKDLVLFNTEALELEKYIHQRTEILNVYNDCIFLRKTKEEAEIKLIQESIDCTKDALEVVLNNLHPGMYEYQIEAVFDKEIKCNGQRDHAFKTICAAGLNATILHYTANNSMINDGDLVLFDLGCRTEFYVSDISRTYPANGKFSPRQREIYEIVLETNKKCIEFLHDGVSFKEYNDYCNSLLIAGLKRIGKITEDSELKNYYWHSVGHPTGLDTHDPCPRNELIVSGMIMTVEPGLYFEDEGIGVRIEDNVLITKDGTINLSEGIIKEIDDIENFMKK